MVYAGYSYWTLGYVLTLNGAKKLLGKLTSEIWMYLKRIHSSNSIFFLAANPLQNLIPVDEYIPIMFGQHFNQTWKKAFDSNEKLTAWSAAPLILFPTRYTGEEGYISDTEESDLIQVESEYYMLDIDFFFGFSCGFVSTENEKEKKGDKEHMEHAITSQMAADDSPLDTCSVSEPDQYLAKASDVDGIAYVIDSVKEQTSLNKPNAHHGDL